MRVHKLFSPVGPNRKVLNILFYEYFHKKQAEGKTKRQALKCVERRLINIIWTMLTNSEDFVNLPVLNEPKEQLKKGCAPS